MREADIVSDETLGQEDSLMYPWLSPTPSPEDPEQEAQLVTIPRRPLRSEARVSWEYII